MITFKTVDDGRVLVINYGDCLGNFYNIDSAFFFQTIDESIGLNPQEFEVIFNKMRELNGLPQVDLCYSACGAKL